MRRRTLLSSAAAAALAAILPAAASPVPAEAPPPGLAAIQAREAPAGHGMAFAGGERAAAVRLAALGYGARAGLARRSWEIAAMLERHATRLDAIYRFADLMLGADGFAVLPPVLAETRRAFRLDRSGARAARAGQVLRIVEPARLAGAAPGWRDWLRRRWPAAAPPAAVLFPRDADETVRWRRLLAEGWAQGMALADEVFAADLDRLNRTFEGMVLWHRLRRAGMVTAPGIEVARSGVSGHERLMRVRAASAGIAAGVRFELDARRWAAPREDER